MEATCCVICLTEGVPLLLTHCVRGSFFPMEFKHDSVMCMQCALTLCTRGVADMTHPKCPMCRRPIYVDCLKALGWKEGAVALDKHWKELMANADKYVRYKFDIVGDFTPEHKPLRERELSKMKKTISMLAIVFLDCALNRLAPGPVHTAADILDDRLWAPEQTQVFYTVAVQFGQLNHLVLVWNGPSHGLCYRIGYTSTGMRTLQKAVLPFFHRDRILARRERRLEVERLKVPATRARIELYEKARLQMMFEEHADFCASLNLIAPDLLSSQ